MPGYAVWEIHPVMKLQFNGGTSTTLPMRRGYATANRH
jgi:hypothetical protein